MIYPIAATLQQSTMVRRAQADQLAQMLRPDLARRHAVVVSTTAHQASHAVGENQQLLQRCWPLLEKRLNQSGKRSPVDGRMQTGVVVNVNRCVLQGMG
jgi:hypothetical protein